MEAEKVGRKEEVLPKDEVAKINESDANLKEDAALKVTNSQDSPKPADLDIQNSPQGLKPKNHDLSLTLDNIEKKAKKLDAERTSSERQSLRNSLQLSQRQSHRASHPLSNRLENEVSARSFSTDRLQLKALVNAADDSKSSLGALASTLQKLQTQKNLHKRKASRSRSPAIDLQAKINLQKETIAGEYGCLDLHTRKLKTALYNIHSEIVERSANRLVFEERESCKPKQYPNIRLSQIDRASEEAGLESVGISSSRIQTSSRNEPLENDEVIVENPEENPSQSKSKSPTETKCFDKKEGEEQSAVIDVSKQPSVEGEYKKSEDTPKKNLEGLEESDIPVENELENHRNQDKEGLSDRKNQVEIDPSPLKTEYSPQVHLQKHIPGYLSSQLKFPNFPQSKLFEDHSLRSRKSSKRGLNLRKSGLENFFEKDIIHKNSENLFQRQFEKKTLFGDYKVLKKSRISQLEKNKNLYGSHEKLGGLFQSSSSLVSKNLTQYFQEEKAKIVRKAEVELLTQKNHKKMNINLFDKRPPGGITSILPAQSRSRSPVGALEASNSRISRYNNINRSLTNTIRTSPLLTRSRSPFNSPSKPKQTLKLSQASQLSGLKNKLTQPKKQALSNLIAASFEKNHSNSKSGRKLDLAETCLLGNRSSSRSRDFNHLFRKINSGKGLKSEQNSPQPSFGGVLAKSGKISQQRDGVDFGSGYKRFPDVLNEYA